MILLSELPLARKIRAIFKRVGTSSQPLSTGGRKRVRPQNDGGKKKSRISFEELDVSKELLKWTKPELEAYLIYHQIKKTGTKPELIRRIQEHMAGYLWYHIALIHVYSFALGDVVRLHQRSNYTV